MKLVRPHIPIRVRLEVIARQVQLRDVLQAAAHFQNASERLKYLLWSKFGSRKHHLDHDPPLCLREIIDADIGKYQPDANDPNFLIYRTEEDHRIKTFVRGDGAQLSDAAKRRKEINRNRIKRPSRWPPRGSRSLRSASRW